MMPDTVPPNALMQMLYDSTIGTTIRESATLFPWIESVHVLMIAAVVVAVMAIPVASAVAGAVARRVFVGVPAVLHEQHALAAGMVIAAMTRPMLDVARRHAQVDRRRLDIAHRALHDDRLAIHHLRLRIIADVDAAVEARLADAEGHRDIGGERGGGQGQQAGGEDLGFHVFYSGMLSELAWASAYRQIIPPSVRQRTYH